MLREARAVLFRFLSFYERADIQRVLISSREKAGRFSSEHLAAARDVSAQALTAVLPAFGLRADDPDAGAVLNRILSRHVPQDELARRRYLHIIELLGLPEGFFSANAGLRRIFPA